MRAFPVVDALLPGRERSSLPGEILRGGIRLPLDEGHHLPGDFKRLAGVIGDVQHDQHVGEPHHPDTDLPRLLHHLPVLRQRIPAHVDGIVQEMHRLVCPLFQLRVIDLSPLYHVAEIDAAQNARLIRQQRLLPAAVRGFQSPERGRRVVPLHPVKEHHPRIAGRPCLLCHEPHNAPCRFFPNCLFCPRVLQLV
ncbi:MAG: hypothetical protein QT04_C0046G0017 [archaeon GW2011_AR11]|nr:MAG: hypothetical protein QT04_C0046G0017 [archaeon GW2011_AR11]